MEVNPLCGLELWLFVTTDEQAGGGSVLTAEAVGRARSTVLPWKQHILTSHTLSHKH